jgi:hypothetical protein
MTLYYAYINYPKEFLLLAYLYSDLVNHLMLLHSSMIYPHVLTHPH